MEITAKELKTALGYLKEARKKKGDTMPILQNIAVKGYGEHAVFIATDMDQQITFKADCICDDVEFTVEFDKLFSWSSKLKDDKKVSLNQDNNVVVAKCLRSTARLRSMPYAEFPFFAEDSEDKEISFNGSDLVDAIKKVSNMAAINDVRYYLNGVALDVRQDKCNVVATDGHRLIKVELPCDNKNNLEGFVILPALSISGFVKCLDDQPVSMHVAKGGYVRFSDSIVSYASKLIDGKYPDYNRVIPKNNDKELRFNCEELKEAANRAATVSTEKHKGMKLAVEGNECSITVSAKDDTGAYEVISVISNSDIEIGLNAKYLTDAVNKVDTEEITLMVSDDYQKAVVIQDENTEMAIMQMRL